MHAERLLRVARLVERLPKKAFNMSFWRGAGNDGCGTAGCAVGHACLDPWFNKQGLLSEADTGTPIYFGPNGRKHDSWDAVERFFGLSEKEAEHLFASFTYLRRPTRTSVAKRIRAFVTAGKSNAR